MSEGEWFSVRALYESCLYASKGGPRLDDPEPIFEEKTLVVFCGTDEDEEIVLTAGQKAHALEEEYENVDGETVRWEFRELLEIQSIGYELKDGSEVFYRLWHEPDEDNFEFIRRHEGDAWWRPGEPESDDGQSGAGAR